MNHVKLMKHFPFFSDINEDFLVISEFRKVEYYKKKPWEIYISHQLCGVNNGRSQGARENGRCLKGSIGNLVTNSRAKQASSRTLLFLHFRAHPMCDQI